MRSTAVVGEYNEFGLRRANSILSTSSTLPPRATDPYITLSRSTFPCFSLCTAYQCADPKAFHGGDFYDAMPLPDGGVALLIGDASGKGQGVATRAAEVRYLLRAFLRTDVEPVRAVSQVNDVLCQQKIFNTFTTLTLAVIYPERHLAKFITAGGEPPLLLHADGKQSESLAAPGGLPLGILPNQVYSVTEIPVQSGDLLMLFTDGITEARGEGTLFGTDGVVGAVNHLIAWEKPEAITVDTITNEVFTQAMQFHARKTQDDRCLMVAQFCYG